MKSEIQLHVLLLYLCTEVQPSFPCSISPAAAGIIVTNVSSNMKIPSQITAFHNINKLWKIIISLYNHRAVKRWRRQLSVGHLVNGLDGGWEELEALQRLSQGINGEIIGVRRRGRPKKRWLQDVWDDINTMRVTGWREKDRHRDIWRRIVKEAKAHKGL